MRFAVQHTVIRDCKFRRQTEKGCCSNARYMQGHAQPDSRILIVIFMNLYISSLLRNLLHLNVPFKHSAAFSYLYL